MRETTIRKAEPRDLESLGRLGAMLMRTHFDFDPKRFLRAGSNAEEGYASFLGSMLSDEDAMIFVAEDGGEVTGYVFAALEPLSWKELRGPAGFIHDIAVLEKSRRTGTARRLLEAATTWLRERKAPRVVLWTAAPNSAAQQLFRRAGFRETMIEMTMELD
jgi:ribosomal protein S18 acetylase RimI-like enzyme